MRSLKTAQSSSRTPTGNMKKATEEKKKRNISKGKLGVGDLLKSQHTRGTLLPQKLQEMVWMPSL